ncbi:MAG: dTDP-glucose 4,6-dehydratase [Syntrophobacteraceae bacterium]
MKTLLVTGGAGFIGSNFVLAQIKQEDVRIINLDILTYAGNLMNLESVQDASRYTFIRGDIGNYTLLRSLLAEYRPDAIVNFAAESHVDRSIVGPDDFISTNVVGTFQLLKETRLYWESLSATEQAAFRFLHISTDEVYGSLGGEDPPFSEQTPYAPNSPYSASKAAGDHLVRAYHHTYGLPTLTTNCSNNYGPRQFPEKLIPLTILNALSGKALPIYGDGLNIRDWLYVEDHCEALGIVLTHGRVGEVYNVGGRCEKTNIEIVQTICRLLDEICPNSPFVPHASLITFVKDRPGHDRRYAIDSSKIENELGWRPREILETGLRKTLLWYLENNSWVDSIRTGAYRDWIERNYGTRG